MLDYPGSQKSSNLETLGPNRNFHYATIKFFCFFPITGGLRYMREIGTLKIGSHIMNLHIKRPRLTLN